jgi:hypothetical protein
VGHGAHEFKDEVVGLAGIGVGLEQPILLVLFVFVEESVLEDEVVLPGSVFEA